MYFYLFKLQRFIYYLTLFNIFVNGSQPNDFRLVWLFVLLNFLLYLIKHLA